MIKKLPLSLAIAGILLASCSSSDDDSDSPIDTTGTGAGVEESGLPDDDVRPGAGETDLPTDDAAPGTPASDTAPSDEELQQSDGVVDADQAYDLAVGRWRSMDDATQCTTSYTFGPDETFVLTGLDQVASGFYFFDDDAGFEDDGGLSIVFDFEEDNFGSDCFGESDNTLEDGVTYSRYVYFPDRNTMILSARPNVGGFTMEFERQ